MTRCRINLSRKILLRFRTLLGCATEEGLDLVLVTTKVHVYDSYLLNPIKPTTLLINLFTFEFTLQPILN